MAFNMSGEMDVLGEVETVQEGEEVRCQGGGGQVNIDVKVAGE